MAISVRMYKIFGRNRDGNTSRETMQYLLLGEFHSCLSEGELSNSDISSL